MIEFDVETTSLQLHGAVPADLFLVQFHDGEETAVLKHPDEREKIQEWLSRDDQYRAWNTKFDLHALKQAGYTLPDESRWHDGMVAAHIIDERSSVALQARGNRLFGEEGAQAATEDAVKDWLKKENARRRKQSKEDGAEYIEANYSDVPDEIMFPYAAHDVELTAQIGEVYDHQLETNADLKQVYDLERRVLRALFAMESRGIPMDRDALAKMEADILPQLDKLEMRCREIAEFDAFNPRSYKHISEALDRADADTRFMTRDADTRILKTDQENLEACDHPLAEAILEYRGTHKMYAMLRGILHTGSNDGKFPSAYLDDTDRLHPNFRQVGARTGRMSCANPNFQQVPRDDLRLRYAVAAGPGKKLVACDLDSIEMRLLAAFAGDGALLDAIKNDRDVHTLTAERVGLLGRSRTTGAAESPRDQGKRMNYLIIYGGGTRAIRKWFGMGQSDARATLQRMHRAYPEVSALQARIEGALDDRGFVKSPITGRHWRLQGSGWQAVQKEGYRFINYLIQGTAADVIKIATARCHEAGIDLIAVIHDEILAEVDADKAEEAAKIIEEAMTEGFDAISSKVPITAEAKIVDRWSQAKDPDYVPDYIKESE